MNNEKNFINGMRFYPPHPRAPKWVIGSISVKVADFLTYAQEYQNAQGWLNIDVKESQKGTPYLELNTYSKEKVEQNQHLEEGFGEPEIPMKDKDDDLPF